MEARHRLDGLHLDNDSVSDDQIETIAGIEPKALIFDRQVDLSPNRQSSPYELMREAMLIGRLQQTWAERPMDLDGAIEHLAANRFEFGWQAKPPFVVFVSFVVFVFHAGPTKPQVVFSTWLYSSSTGVA